MKTARTRLALLFAALTTANLLAQPTLAPDPKFQVRLATPVEADAWNWLVQSDGKIVISGGFEFIRGTSTVGMARLQPDGTVDTSFKPEIEAMCVGLLAGLQSGDRVLFSGVLGGTNRLYRLDPRGQLDPTFNGPMSVNWRGDVIGVVGIMPDDRLICYRAWFDQAANRTEADLFRLHPDGAIDSTFSVRVGEPGSSDLFYSLECPRGGHRPPYHGEGLVNAVVPLSDGKFLVGGSFATISGRPRHDLVRLNANGTLDESFQWPMPATSSGRVKHVIVQDDGKLLIGGDWVSTEVCGVLRLLPDGTVDPNFNSMFPHGAGKQTCLGLLGIEPGGNVLIAASLKDLQTYEISGSRIIELRSDGTSAGEGRFSPEALGGGTYVGPDPAFRILPDGKLLIRRTGPEWFTSYLIRLNTDWSTDQSFRPVVPEVRGGDVHILARSGEKLILSGSFTSVNGHVSPRLARLNADGTVDTSFVADVGVPETWYGDARCGWERRGAIIPLPGGSLYVLGVGPVVKLHPDGSMDSSFRSALAFRFTSGNIGCLGPGNLSGCSVQADGRLIVGDLRLNSDGSVDPTFSPASLEASVAVQNGEQLVLPGSFIQVEDRGTVLSLPAGWVVARDGLLLSLLEPDGTQAASFEFGDDFKPSFQIPGSGAEFDATMGVLLAGFEFDRDTGEARWAMRRYQFIPVFRQPRWTPGLRFTATLGLLPGVPHRIETSTDLANWQTVTTVTSATENLPFTDPEAATVPRRFYRAIGVNP